MKQNDIIELVCFVILLNVISTSCSLESKINNIQNDLTELKAKVK